MPLRIIWFISTIFSWNCIKSLTPDRFLLYPLQLHNIKSIMSYGCSMTIEVWWKRLLKFRSIGMNRSFATKMWFFVPYIDCQHLTWIVLWVFIKGNKSKLTCTEMLSLNENNVISIWIKNWCHWITYSNHTLKHYTSICFSCYLLAFYPYYQIQKDIEGAHGVAPWTSRSAVECSTTELYPLGNMPAVL